MTAGNWLRQMSLERDIKTWEDTFGPITDDAAQRLVDNINHATMAGDIGRLGSNASALSQTFFSVRAKASLFQFFGDAAKAVGPGTDPVVRRIIAKRMAGFLTLNMGLLYTAKMAGAQTGLIDADLDPWSPKFGKIKAGGQTYDVWGGYAPIVRTILQAGKGNENAVGNYTRNQFSPFAGVAYDLSFGRWKTYDNKELSLKEPKGFGKYAGSRATPILFQDIYKAWQANGFVGTIVPAAAAFSGIGVGENFDPSETKEKAAAKSGLEKEVQKLDPSIYINDSGQVATDPDSIFKMDSWKQYLASDLGYSVEELNKFGSLEATKKAYVDWYVSTHDQVGAKQDGEAGFERFQSVKDFRAEEQSNLLEFWKAHPDLLEKATESGANKLNEKERELLPSR